MGKEEDELNELWSVLKDEVKDKRQKIQNEYSQRNVSEFPDTLSITTAFDEILSCFSLGGQFKNYYRYGSYSLCTQQREKFWFAIQNGSFTDSKQNEGDLEKRKNIQEFFKKRLLEQKAMGSSEDVWDARTQLLDRPFQEFDRRN
ncbi:hypothetical protein CAAN1_21S00760 [[Candida] anglica]|uniref:Uncharacterized protein n=1 Tax=[Candida] anglica TaxID=148631 RepID=A0ABP0EDV8_9ASCO